MHTVYNTYNMHTVCSMYCIQMCCVYVNAWYTNVLYTCTVYKCTVYMYISPGYFSCLAVPSSTTDEGSSELPKCLVNQNLWLVTCCQWSTVRATSSPWQCPSSTCGCDDWSSLLPMASSRPEVWPELHQQLVLAFLSISMANISRQP